MRILAITDVHGRMGPVEGLSELVGGIDPDLILIAGDITNFGNAARAEKILRPLISSGVKVLAVHGNCDGRDVPDLLDSLGIGVHGRRVELGGFGVVGIGGSNVTPFSTVWELTEDEIAAILRRNYRDGDIILSHVPPKDTEADKVHSGLHVGSPALRGFIEERKPPLVVCGHIHEARSVDRIGDAMVVNPGPLFRGYYAIIEFDKTGKKVEQVELARL